MRIVPSTGDEGALEDRYRNTTQTDVNLQLISVDIAGGVKYAGPALPARAVSPGGKGGSAMTSNPYLSSGGVRTCASESSTSNANASRTNVSVLSETAPSLARTGQEVHAART